jgi:hypothetical protein
MARRAGGLRFPGSAGGLGDLGGRPPSCPQGNGYANTADALLEHSRFLLLPVHPKGSDATSVHYFLLIAGWQV